MAENDDAEVKAALAAFMRDWIGEDFFAKGKTEEDFENMVEQISRPGEDAGLAKMLRMFHALQGRYALFKELCTPGTSRSWTFSDKPLDMK